MIIEPSVTFHSEQQLYHFQALNSYKAVAHVVTTRNSFFCSDFNLSFHTGKEEQVIENRNRLCQFFKAKTLTIPKQCHGSTIAQITKDNSGQIPMDTDALITNIPGLAIGVLSADCVPVLFYDPSRQALGAAHAGWKGTLAGIASATVKSMENAYGSNPADLIVCIGPSISQPHFEVGEEVADRFHELGLSACITKAEGEKPHIDLWLANSLLLQKAGILAAHIHTAGVCTVDHTDQFYSARGEGFGTGRFGAFIMLQ
ncbi:MAG: peptidoglycan editing factor PgeF [Cytophagaceae bacterium]|nr:peptidoglycan editing factor PgeF [Cytophagaceae bacterium]